jgi:hypothetical protein
MNKLQKEFLNESFEWIGYFTGTSLMFLISPILGVLSFAMLYAINCLRIPKWD